MGDASRSTTGSSHIAGRRRVSYEEILDHFVARTGVSSGFGAQLERARDGMSGGAADAAVTQARDEVRRLRTAGVLRCVDALAGYASIRWSDCPCDDVRKLAQRAKLGDGAAVCLVLGAYQPRAVSWPKQALVEVYELARRLDARLPALEGTADKTPAQLFREGKHPNAERRAAALVADAQLVVRSWVERWNRPARPLAVMPEDAA